MNQPQILTSHPPTGELPPMPLDSSLFLEGTPTARGSILAQSKDKLTSVGFWTCTAGKFKWTYTWDEFVHILEGEVTIREESGATHTLKAGDVAHFPRGLTTYWHVPRFVKKFFCLRTSEPLII
jgi:uncharacterized cupin superfamily protein